ILDWKDTWIDNKRFPYTPHVSDIYALESTLTQVLEEGMERYVNRHQSIAHACREGAKALGFDLWPAREEIAATCVTAVKVPAGFNEEQLRNTMRHKYGCMNSSGSVTLFGK